MLFGLELGLLGVEYTPFRTNTGTIRMIIHLDTTFPSCVSEMP